ncbi:hypothetical protein A6E13_16495 [Aliivibrio fischeri]|uniref:hypothetical protein n=1 Tax=Aliivibrio fischeri TaxID=668 RepID=UPI00080E0EAF|nr:hypothetical protein [Aliivibrio fischeri]OCH31821.1 hypothetical protein A6E13_16495 [Aliivibrio fischeri]
MTTERSDITTGDQPSDQTLRKRAERERKRAAGLKDRSVTLSPHYQAITQEILDYTGITDFNELTQALIKAYHQKVTAHKQKHQCCGKCGDPYKPGGACVFEGDYYCQYSHGGQYKQELKP